MKQQTQTKLGLELKRVLDQLDPVTRQTDPLFITLIERLLDQLNRGEVRVEQLTAIVFDPLKRRRLSRFPEIERILRRHHASYQHASASIRNMLAI